MTSIKRVLVANRGEIALRILRTLKALGIETVIVYSDDDRESLVTRLADTAFCIGAGDGYLRRERIIECALACGAEAIHPGYGFLAEDATFAQQVEDAGIIFLGPTPHQIATLGSKATAADALRACGFEITTQHSLVVDSLIKAGLIAERIGYPVLLKAAAGGGGKGIRVVATPDDLEAAWHGARDEARAGFHSDQMIVERFIADARHIEVQVVGDGFGGIQVATERDCSLQRRMQKILEETPSPAVDERLRERLLSTTAHAMSQLKYRSAGTLEFLMTDSGDVFFLEINTRIQVEHGITELTTGLDTVAAQINVARGGRLPQAAEGLDKCWRRNRGAAVEFRVNAEDPHRGWLPSTGTIRHLRWPAGTGIRVDSALDVGAEVTANYDSLLGKIMAWAPDRETAFARLHTALAEAAVVGCTTTLNLGIDLCRDEGVRTGKYHCRYLERLLEDRTSGGAPISAELRPAAAAAAAWLRHSQRDRTGLQADASANALTAWQCAENHGGQAQFAYSHQEAP